ncbi:DUF4177 domain-containing protein [Falsirhodobacter sp. 20TX0035]|uniref:DUF4177 domain-containing protein n=1 Tax=Falsirhodobacter sp. 20TX0035 TaxID=3022019 RepID=UPI00232C300C|nr:DUF4177 domain-containing protein [Falsirhodobacter sp. 20TX0035]MDB6453148.1 DUF4177 domain-containing protein [Falsirhodobacter sp. 20TX0035]
MTRFEYQVVPAPSKGEKARGVRNGTERFALALAAVMNRMGREGWEYVRAESLPAEEKSGLFRSATTLQHVLVFRRTVGDDTARMGAVEVTTGSVQALPVANAPEGVSRPIGPAV